MGNCMGSCVSVSRSLFDDDKSDFINLANDTEDENSTHRCFLMRHFFKSKGKNNQKTAVLDLVEDIFSSKDNNYTRLNENTISTNKQEIPLQCLDARALLVHTANSTPASSLDLEWEHETLPMDTVIQDPCSSSWVFIPMDNCPLEANASQSTGVEDNNTEWSRVPSADSLEWDSIQNSLLATPLPDIDADTQALLNEIERLTEQALKETGQTFFS